MIVFDKLWETMKAKHVSTYALRDRFDIDSRTIRRLRANQTVTTDTLDKLCRILDCKLYERWCQGFFAKWFAGPGMREVSQQ